MTPAAAAGKVDVTVITLDGGTGTLVQGYNYLAVTPTITSLSADYADKIGGISRISMERILIIANSYSERK